MAETQLINIADVSVYRKIDTKINIDRFNAFVTSIQRKNLKELLGDALYYELMCDDRATGKYYLLVEGHTYTFNNNIVYYYGLKPCLSYWLLALLAREGELFHSTHGAVEFINDTQRNFNISKEKERIAVSYMNDADVYANDVKKYLNNHPDTYTLWNNSDITNQDFISFKL